MQSEEEYIRLLAVLLHVDEANKGLPAGEDNRILDAEGLAQKVTFHALSVLYLSRSTRLPEIGADFFDPASINVLGRAALEAFLVFHYVFVNPKSDYEKDFRYSSWVLADLLVRQSYPVQSPQGKRILESERTRIEELRTRLKNNVCFANLTPGQQKGLLSRGIWRLQGWTDIALAAGLNETQAKAFYRHLSSYAHAGSLSVLQLRQAGTANDQRSLYFATIGLVMITMAYMVKAYCAVFPRSQAALQKDQSGALLVDQWVQIGATSLDEVSIDWEAIDS
jgi:hypothetical protein